jgi:hypothetical protein
MIARSYGLIVLVLSLLVLGYLSTGLMADAPPLLALAAAGGLGGLILGLLMLSGRA